jgi:hypothetical protein
MPPRVTSPGSPVRTVPTPPATTGTTGTTGVTAPVATGTTTTVADTSGPSSANGANWRAFTASSAPIPARITGFGTPMMDGAGTVRFAWHKKGDTIPFEMTVEVQGDPAKARAEVWTNANRNDDPTAYAGVGMKVVKVEGTKVTFRADVPVDRIGNYRACGRVSTDDGQNWQWAGQHGIGDIRFRPRDDAFDNLNMEEVNIGNVNQDPVTGKPGTFADMMESGSPLTNGKYTLEYLAAQGKNSIWLMPPFEVSKWDQRHPLDDAGSPYAVKDFFSVRTEFSRAARGLTGDAARDAAMKEFKDFMAKAHALGIKVILDLPLNHVGHNYEFRDLFTRYDQAGNEIREVRANDFSKIAVKPEQLDVIKNRLADPNVPKYMEHIAPWLYVSRSGDTRGAQSAEDKAPGGFFEWPDTAQLNHGRMRWGYSWWDPQPTQEQQALQGWMTRILQFWAVDQGVDGFRLDHLTGLPLSMLEQGANLVQADVDKHQPGKHVFMMGEDFHTDYDTKHWLDNKQGGYFHGFLAAKTPGDFQNLVDSPYFRDLLNLDSHDEDRFINHFGDDVRGATRLACVMQTFGGPVAELAGGSLAERWKLPFKQYRGVHALRNVTSQGAEMAKIVGRMGNVRKDLPALQDDNRYFLPTRTGVPDSDLLAMSRWPDDKKGNIAFVFANLNNGAYRENAFNLDPETRSRVDPNKKYQVRNLMGDNPGAGLWNPPLTGQELLDRGLFCGLQPYEIQVLRLEEA